MTTRVIPSFDEYFEPRTVKEALNLISNYNSNAKILAGGTDLLVALKEKRIKTTLINIKRIPGLDSIEYGEKDGLRIGTLALLRALELSKVVREKYHVLSDAASQMATIQVRNMGTVGGNICNASPAADLAPPLLVLDARAKVVSLKESKEIPLTDFFIKPGQTVLKAGEMLSEILVPILPSTACMAFLKIGRSAVDIAKINIAVALTLRDGVCTDARVALGSVGPTPFRAKKTEVALQGRKMTEDVIDEAAETVAAEISPISDVRSTSEYRCDTSKALLKRAVKMAIEMKT